MSNYWIFFPVSRLIKIISNALKVISYPFHFFFPNKRFTIPEFSAALVKRKSSQKIPRVIFQTNYTHKVALPVYLNYLFNRLMALNYDYRFFSTERRAEFIQDNFSKDIVDSYKKLRVLLRRICGDWPFFTVKVAYIWI